MIGIISYVKHPLMKKEQLLNRSMWVKVNFHITCNLHVKCAVILKKILSYKPGFQSKWQNWAMCVSSSSVVPIFSLSPTMNDFLPRRLAFALF